MQEVPNAAWQAHTYISYGDPANGVRNQILLYGEPCRLEGFCDLAQISNYVQYRRAPYLIFAPLTLPITGSTFCYKGASQAWMQELY